MLRPCAGRQSQEYKVHSYLSAGLQRLPLSQGRRSEGLLRVPGCGSRAQRLTAERRPALRILRHEQVPAVAPQRRVAPALQRVAAAAASAVAGLLVPREQPSAGLVQQRRAHAAEVPHVVEAAVIERVRSERGAQMVWLLLRAGKRRRELHAGVLEAGTHRAAVSVGLWRMEHRVLHRVPGSGARLQVCSCGSLCGGEGLTLEDRLRLDQLVERRQLLSVRLLLLQHEAPARGGRCSQTGPAHPHPSASR